MMKNALALRLGVKCRSRRHPAHAAGRRAAGSGSGSTCAIAARADGNYRASARDRRTRDVDMARLKAESQPLNFEMAATEDMMRISLATKPHAVCSGAGAPRGTHHRGRLDVVGSHKRWPLSSPGSTMRHPGVAVHLRRSAADPTMAARLRAPVIEIHTGGWCDAVVDGHTARPRRNAAHRQGCCAGARRRARGPCRPWPRLRDRGDHRRPSRNRRTQHRLLHARGGACSSALPKRSARCDQPWTVAANEAWARHDIASVPT